MIDAPSFYGIGAQKAGTSWLYRHLDEHPDFAMPLIKELHYFDRMPSYPSDDSLSLTLLQRLCSRSKFDRRWWLHNRLRQLSFCLRNRQLNAFLWHLRFSCARYDDNWYRRLFSRPEGKIAGDITPSYSLLDARDVAKMQQIAPDAKILFLLREPVQRTWSAIRFHAMTGNMDGMDSLHDPQILKSLLNEPGWAGRADYRRTLSTFLEFFPKGNFLIGFYDAIRDQPEQLLGNIVSFLGGSTQTVAVETLAQRVNASPSQKMPEHVRETLQSHFAELNDWLATTFGGYAQHWADRTSGVARAEQTKRKNLPPPTWQFT